VYCIQINQQIIFDLKFQNGKSFKCLIKKSEIGNFNVTRKKLKKEKESKKRENFLPRSIW